MSTSPVTSTAVTLPPAGTYAIDTTRSVIRFYTRHIFGLGRVRGSFAVRSGRIEAGASPGRSSAAAEIDAGSFTTGNGTRDHAVRSARYLNVERHPTILFVSGEGLSAGTAGLTASAACR